MEEPTMGLLDDLVRQLGQSGGPLGGDVPGARPRTMDANAAGGPDLVALAQTVMAMLGDQRQGGFGGLQGMVEAFQRNGLGDVVASWVGRGQNLPVSLDQLREALGTERVTRVATQAGLSADQGLGALAELLPQLVDRLTPDGRVPDQQNDLLSMGLDFLRGAGRRPV